MQVAEEVQKRWSVAHRLTGEIRCTASACADFAPHYACIVLTCRWGQSTAIYYCGSSLGFTFPLAFGDSTGSLSISFVLLTILEIVLRSRPSSGRE